MVAKVNGAQKRAKKRYKTPGNIYMPDQMGIIERAINADWTKMDEEQIVEFTDFLNRVAAQRFKSLKQFYTEAKDWGNNFYEAPDPGTRSSATKVRSYSAETLAKMAVTIDNILGLSKRAPALADNIDIEGLDEEHFKFIANLSVDDFMDDEGNPIFNSAELDRFYQAVDNRLEGTIVPEFTKVYVKIMKRRTANSVIYFTESGEFRTRTLSQVISAGQKVLRQGAMDVREKVFEYIKASPLAHIDRALKSGPSEDQLYRHIVEPLSIAQARVQEKRDAFANEIEEFVLKNVKSKSKREEMTIKLMLIALQEEHDANPDNPNIFDAKQYLLDTEEAVDSGASKFHKDQAKKVRKIFNKYADSEGNFNLEKAKKSMTSVEKTVVQRSNDFLSEARKKETINATRQGVQFKPHEKYVPLIVLYNERESLDEIALRSTEMMNENVSVKTQRKKIRKKGKKPLDFNYISAVRDATVGAETEYQFTQPLRYIGSGLTSAIARLKAQKKEATTDAQKEQIDTQLQIVQGINDSIRFVTKNVFQSNFYKPTKTDRIIQNSIKRVYQATLASFPRMIKELVSNLAHIAIYKRQAYSRGGKYLLSVFKKDDSEVNQDLINLLHHSKSVHRSRLYPRGAVGLRLEENMVDRMSTSWFGRKADTVSDWLNSTPDKMVARALWVGVFKKSFEDITGEKLDIKAVDEKFVTDPKYTNAVNAARSEADSAVIEAVASTNPFEGIMASQITPKDAFTARGMLRLSNVFLTRFTRFEFASAAKAADQILNSPKDSKDYKEGYALMGATITRMWMYSAMGDILSQGLSIGTNILAQMIAGDDEEKEKLQALLNEEWEEFKKVENLFVRPLVGTIVTLAFGRRLGNLSKIPVTATVEFVNKEVTERVFDDEYSKYEDSLMFALINPDDGVPTDYEWLMTALGPAARPLKAIERVFTLFNRAMTSKNEETRDRAWAELFIRGSMDLATFSVGVPFGRDISKILMYSFYAEYIAQQKGLSNDSGRPDGRKLKKKNVKKVNKKSKKTIKRN